LLELHTAGRLQFFGPNDGLSDRRAFNRHLAPVRRKRWVVYAKPPFSGPEAVLAYLSRYTHRVAISNRRLISFGEDGVTFRFKDYRRSEADRHRTMTLPADEFIRRFLLHVLPRGFHRIRHYGLLASGSRKANVARARELLAVMVTAGPATSDEPADSRSTCPCCGGRMVVIDIFEPTFRARAPPRLCLPAGMMAP
jgi:hypothetical protein